MNKILIFSPKPKRLVISRADRKWSVIESLDLRTDLQLAMLIHNTKQEIRVIEGGFSTQKVPRSASKQLLKLSDITDIFAYFYDEDSDEELVP